MARNAFKHTARRSQRTSKRRYLRWNQANVRSAWKRGTALLTGRPRGFWGFPLLGNLGAEAASAEALAQVFGIIAPIRRQGLESLARSALLTGADVQGIQQRDDSGPLVTIRGRGTRGQRHTGGVRKAVKADALAFPAVGNAFIAAVARGNTSHPPYRMATAPGRVPRRARAAGLAWQLRCHRPASVAASAARRSWTPIGRRGGGHTRGSR
jgi:hypothetical protein